MKTILFLFLLFPGLIMAQDSPIDFGSASSVITWLMPVLTLAFTWLIKKIAPFVTGTVTLIVVPLVSTGLAYLGTVISNDTSWLISFLVGLGSVFLNQFYKYLTSPPAEE